MHEVCIIRYSKTNKDKYKDIIPPLLLKPPYICARAMPRAKKDKQKIQILKKTTVCWSLGIISLWVKQGMSCFWPFKGGLTSLWEIFTVFHYDPTALPNHC